MILPRYLLASRLSYLCIYHLYLYVLIIRNHFPSLYHISVAGYFRQNLLIFLWRRIPRIFQKIVSVAIINFLLASILECPLSPSPPGTRTVASSANNGNRAIYLAGWLENCMEGSLAKCVRALTFHVFSLDAIQFAGEKAAENTSRWSWRGQRRNNRYVAPGPMQRSCAPKLFHASLLIRIIGMLKISVLPWSQRGGGEDTNLEPLR